jgi:hypothetical protein
MVEVIERNFCEEAERAQVDPQHWNSSLGYGSRRGEQGAISSQNYHEIQWTGGHLFTREDFNAGGMERGLDIDHDLVLMLEKPGQQRRDDLCQLRLTGFRNYCGRLVG